jgi:lipoate-protein ligase A
LNELLKIKVNFNLLQEIIIDSIKTTFKLDLKELLLTDTDLNSINNLIKYKYRRTEWNYNKNRTFNE